VDAIDPGNTGRGRGGDELGAFTIRQFCARYNVSRSRVYSEIRQGRLRAAKSGTRTLITFRAARDWERLGEADAAKALASA
jgi:excisionase family DNA binding protein